MFRDLKEYQEIAKIYAEKVSKPENLDENRNQMATKLRLEREANKPAPEPKVKPTYQANRDKLNQQRTELNKGRAEKQFSALKAKPMVRKPGATSVRQSGANDSRLLKNKVDVVADKGPEIKKVEVKKEPEVSTMTKQGKTRTKAQMMAAKRIASGKTIADVKAENQAAMRARAKAKFEAFKKRRAEKKLDKQRDFDDPDKRMNRGESYTPYDIVLEYLLSTEQVATIEEANYVMTEMDAETIQGIVEEQKKTLDEMDMMKMPVINVLGGVGSAIAGTVAAAKYLGRKAGERAIKKEGEKPGKPGLIKTIKDRTDATNKAIEKMKNP